jgi:hypothetical protein
MGGHVCLSFVQLIGDGGSTRDCAQSAPCWAKLSCKFSKTRQLAVQGPEPSKCGEMR